MHKNTKSNASQGEDQTQNMEFNNAKNTGIVYSRENIKIEKSCGVVVFRDCEKENGEMHREYLLLRYPEGHWDFAKGHVEEGESEKETAHREFTEETGIDELKIIDGFREHITYEFYANFDNLKGWIRKTVVFFVGETHACAVTELSHEHHDYDWLSEEEALKKITFDNAREIFENAVTFIKNIRSYNE